MTNNTSIDIKTYKNHLVVLKNQIWKIIPLSQANNPYVLDYIETLTREVFGLAYVIVDLPHDIWYATTLSTLQAMVHDPYNPEEDFRKIKKDVFKVLNLMDKELRRMKG